MKNEALDAQGPIFWGPGSILEGVEKSMIFLSASGRPKIEKDRPLERSGVEKWAAIVRQVGGKWAASGRRRGFSAQGQGIKRLKGRGKRQRNIGSHTPWAKGPANENNWRH